MAISYYTSNSDGSDLYNIANRANKYTVGDGTFKDDRFIEIKDNAEDPFTTQYGYGTAPKSGEDLDALAAHFSNNQPWVADGTIRNFDTTDGNTKFTAETAGTINGSKHHDFQHMMDIIHKELYLPTTGYKDQLNTLASRYNRFKLPNVDMEIKKGYAHVFFVRPQCHLVDERNSNELLPSVLPEGAFSDIFDQNPVLVNEISDIPCGGCSQASDFMYILSNYVKSFSLNDEELHSDTYGKTYTGYKISYGKTNIESKSAGSFSVTFSDDRTLSIYKIHRMWTDYINDVYRGRLDPSIDNIANKVLDYVGAVYYILTAEDNETILFWSKYYGVYPTTIPSSQYSWNAGSFVNPESITIQYNYSWKEDFNTSAMLEFNSNAKLGSSGAGSSGASSIRYDPTFKNSIYYLGPTIVGTPYIERVRPSDVDSGALPYTDKFVYKLRFVPADLM